METDFFKLQNGNDIRGVAMEGVEGEHLNLTPHIVQKIVMAYAKLLSKKTNKQLSQLKISIGNDSRITADQLKKGAFLGLCSLGCRVFDCGLASTPSMFMSTIFEEFKMDGAIMITASHLPYNRNGMKFFDKNGALEKCDIKEILTMAQSVKIAEGAQISNVQEIPLMNVYCEFLKDKIKQGVNAQNYEKPLSGLKVVVDAGNGAGGFFATKVLVPLGADIAGSQFLEPDGMFPNHMPNPENKEAIESLSKAVLAHRADLGLIFDTDVDRAAAVDQYGHAIHRNAIVALMGAIVAQDYPNSIIVTDSVTSDKLTEFLERELHMEHRRFKRGYKNVINEAIRLNQEGRKCQLAIETSGHCAMGENYFLDDGAYVTVKILIEAAKLKKEGKTIDMLISKLQDARETKEFRLKITCDRFQEYGQKVLEDFERYSKVKSGFRVANNSHEGVRVSFDDPDARGWLLIRMSLHDPLLPLNIEADNEGGAKNMQKRMLEFLNDYEYVDTSMLS